MKNIKQVLLWILKNTKSSTIYIIGIILIGSILSILSVSQAMISKSLIDSATLGDSSLIKKWISVLAVLLFTQVVLRSIQTIATTYCSETIKNKIQKSLYSHIIKSSWLDTSKYHSVDFLTRSTNDVSTITNMISTTIPQIVSLVVMLVTAFFALLTISPMMSLLAISIFPFLIILSRLYGRKLKKYYVTLQEKESFYSRFM
ncbi:MAG: ABC transporter transmembrane domain-containing protein, partial [Clostridium sp.]